MSWDGVYYLSDERTNKDGKKRALRHLMVFATLCGGDKMHVGAGVFKVEVGDKAVWGRRFKQRMVKTAKARVQKCPLVLEGSFKVKGKVLVRTMPDGTEHTFDGHHAVHRDLITPVVLVLNKGEVPSVAVRGPRLTAD
jgi:hypothetical protein